MTIETHAALELGVAGALIALPFILGLSPGVVMVSIALGALLGGLAISGSEPGSRGGLSLSAHAAYDWGIAIALIGSAIVLGFASGPSALLVFLTAGAAELALVASTSYSERR
jgi:membrane-bound metal-dependent hydrolase YbcI (DUF457 family)